jgi:hypothetical protein
VICAIHLDRIMKAFSNGGPFLLHTCVGDVGIKISGNGRRLTSHARTGDKPCLVSEIRPCRMLFVAELKLGETYAAVNETRWTAVWETV